MSQRPDDALEKRLRSKGYALVAGVDEAGRGPLAGPVVAAVCILPPDLPEMGIADSKQLKAPQRQLIRDTLINTPGVLYGLGVVDSLIIDQINILQATFEAMIRAVAALQQLPDYLLIDGPLCPKIDLPKQGIIRGDTMVLSIAAASILAKVTRDALMVALAELYPQYGFERNKGYGTAEHRKALKTHGPCPLHRKSFNWN